MLQNLFNPGNALFRWCAKLFDLIVLSVLWAMLSVPIVTMGPATAALYYTVVKCIRRGEPEPYRNFFACFRLNFKVGAIAGILVAALAALALFLYSTLLAMALGGVRAAYLLCVAYSVLLLVLLGVAAFLFPVLSRFTLGLGALFVKSFQLALRHLPSTVIVALIVLQAGTSMLRYLYPVLILPGFAALLISLFLERIFVKYTPTEEPAAQDDEEAEHPWYSK